VTAAFPSADLSQIVTVGDSGEIRVWQVWLDQPEVLLQIPENRIRSLVDQ
jgi:hypothetical protein